MSVSVPIDFYGNTSIYVPTRTSLGPYPLVNSQSFGTYVAGYVAANPGDAGVQRLLSYSTQGGFAVRFHNDYSNVLESALSETINDIAGEDLSAIAQSVSDLSGSVTAFDGELETLSTSVSDLSGSITTFDGELETLSTSVSDLSGSITTFDGELETLSTSVSDLSGSITTFDGELETLSTSVSDLSGSITTFDGELETLSTSVSDLSGSITTFDGELETLSTSVSDLSGSITTFDGELETLSTSVSDLSGSITTFDGELETLSTSVSDLSGSITTFDGELETLSTSVSDFANTFSSVTSSLTELGSNTLQLAGSFNKTMQTTFRRIQLIEAFITSLESMAEFSSNESLTSFAAALASMSWNTSPIDVLGDGGSAAYGTDLSVLQYMIQMLDFGGTIGVFGQGNAIDSYFPLGWIYGAVPPEPVQAITKGTSFTVNGNNYYPRFYTASGNVSLASNETFGLLNTLSTPVNVYANYYYLFSLTSATGIALVANNSAGAYDQFVQFDTANRYYIRDANTLFSNTTGAFYTDEEFVLSSTKFFTTISDNSISCGTNTYEVFNMTTNSVFTITQGDSFSAAIMNTTSSVNLDYRADANDSVIFSTLYSRQGFGFNSSVSMPFGVTISGLPSAPTTFTVNDFSTSISATTTAYSYSGGLFIDRSAVTVVSNTYNHFVENLDFINFGVSTLYTLSKPSYFSITHAIDYGDSNILPVTFPAITQTPHNSNVNSYVTTIYDEWLVASSRTTPFAKSVTNATFSANEWVDTNANKYSVSGQGGQGFALSLYSVSVITCDETNNDGNGTAIFNDSTQSRAYYITHLDDPSNSYSSSISAGSLLIFKADAAGSELIMA